MTVERTLQRLKTLGISEADLKVPRKLTMEEFRAMHPELQAYHIEANGKAVMQMDAEEEKKATEAAQNAEVDVDRFFGRASQEEVSAALEMAARFSRRYPTFVQKVSNTEKILLWLKSHRRSHPRMSDFEEAFADLCRGGELEIDLSKIGERDKIISRYELRTSPALWKILAPSAALSEAEKEKQAISAMSADEFLKATPVLQNQQISPIYRRRFDQCVLTLESFHPEYDRSDANNAILLDYIAKNQAGMPFSATNLLVAFDACKDKLQLKNVTAQFGSTKEVTYDRHESVPERLSKSKLQEKVSAMSAVEYSAWLRDNPTGRSALDALG